MVRPAKDVLNPVALITINDDQFLLNPHFFQGMEMKYTSYSTQQHHASRRRWKNRNSFDEDVAKWSMLVQTSSTKPTPSVHQPRQFLTVTAPDIAGMSFGTSAVLLQYYQSQTEPSQ
jgi:hypothetical protein